MSASGTKSLPAIGFLTVCEHSDYGLFGGFLVLNTHGRPLEFHCTAPVKPNRAQEILYGPTLRGFLYAEQIGQTLLHKAKVAPLLVCTNVEPMLDVREFSSAPVVLIAPEKGGERSGEKSDKNGDKGDKSDKASERGWTERTGSSQVPLVKFTLGAHAAAVRATHEDDRDELLKLWPKLATVVDLTEPFTRIREAIEEARKVA